MAKRAHEGDVASGAPHLEHTPQGLALVAGGLAYVPDLARLAPRVAAGRLGGELLVRAARVRGVEAPRALDATAGLGEDALLLAAAGFSVVLCERDHLVAALLADSLARAAADPRLAAAVSRMRLEERDSMEALAEPGTPPDVVYLDPMFPARTKSAAVRKKAQALQLLERPCDDEGGLLGAALAAHPRKVVVKRPAKGPALAGRRPAYSLRGKAVRFDVYLP